MGLSSPNSSSESYESSGLSPEVARQVKYARILAENLLKPTESGVVWQHPAGTATVERHKQGRFKEALFCLKCNISQVQNVPLLNQNFQQVFYLNDSLQIVGVEVFQGLICIGWNPSTSDPRLKATILDNLEQILWWEGFLK